MKKYQVIGGQYESCWIGESDSLHGAKIIATRNMEYWDNWQGWHKPCIYRAEDVEIVGVARGSLGEARRMGITMRGMQPPAAA